MDFIKGSALTLLLLTGCGYREWTETDCFNGCEGTESDTETSTTTTVVVQGQPGANGSAGSNGTNGRDGVNGSPGATGADGAPGNPGADGSNGTNGNDGTNGTDGYSVVFSIGPATSCTGATIIMATDLNRNGTLDVLADSNIQSTEICNGADGQDAPQNNYTLVDIVDPCGDSPSAYDEVLLRLANGKLLASFSDNVNGLNTRFSVIPPGSYMTTDGTSCHFTVAGDYSVTW